MHAIGISSIKKCSRVCSDHFDDNSFHDTDGYTRIRRLVSNAVPRRITSSIKVLSDTTSTVLNSTDSRVDVLQSIKCNRVSDEFTKSVDSIQYTDKDVTTNYLQVQCNNEMDDNEYCLLHTSSLCTDLHTNSDAPMENSSCDKSNFSLLGTSQASETVSSDYDSINGSEIQQYNKGSSEVEHDHHKSSKRYNICNVSFFLVYFTYCKKYF